MRNEVLSCACYLMLEDNLRFKERKHIPRKQEPGRLKHWHRGDQKLIA
jgi:hypothetical protein